MEGFQAVGLDLDSLRQWIGRTEDVHDVAAAEFADG
jgi:hypothetical protein